MALENGTAIAAATAGAATHAARRVHRDDILPPEPAAVAADDPVSLCLAERLPGIEQMVADGVIDGDQAKLFRERAEALCEHQAGAAAPQ